MSEILYREFVYLAYYFEIQFTQIAGYYLFGIVSGSLISVFLKKRILSAMEAVGRYSDGFPALVLSSALGIASPLCMYGTIPIAASLAKGGIRHPALASFMMSSILLNPQLIVYSAALGSTALAVRILSCFVCGITAGVVVKLSGREFFRFPVTEERQDRDSDPRLWLRYLKNLGRNVKATGPYFLAGILLAALFQRYVPAEFISSLFGKDERFGVLVAATVGVPLYACGGGTIPLLSAWLADGMSMGSAAAFMITGPATKITNLGALKIVLPARKFLLYLVFTALFSLATGLLVNCFV